MAVKASCEPCGWRGKFEDSVAGSKARCLECGKWINVPRIADEDPGYEVVEDDEPETRQKSRPRSCDEDDRRRDRYDDRDRRQRDRDEDDRDGRRRDRDDDDRDSYYVEPEPADPKPSRKPTPKAKIKNRGDQESKSSQPLEGTPAIILGILMMVGAVIWFVCGLVFQNFIYYYPPVLFILGIASLYRGLTGDN